MSAFLGVRGYHSVVLSAYGVFERTLYMHICS